MNEAVFWFGAGMVMCLVLIATVMVVLGILTSPNTPQPTKPPGIYDSQGNLIFEGEEPE